MKVPRRPPGALWRGNLPARQRRERLPLSVPDLDFESTDARVFADLDKIVRGLIEKRRIPDHWVFGEIHKYALNAEFGTSLPRHIAESEDFWPYPLLDIDEFKPNCTYSSIVCVRHWVANAGKKAVERAQWELTESPTEAADVRRVKERLKRLAAELEEFERFVSDDLLMANMKRPPTVRAPWVVDEEMILNDAIAERVAVTRATALLARQQLSELVEHLIEPEPQPTRHDVLTTTFISEMRELWRIITQCEPPRSRTGHFVDFVAAGWQMNGFTRHSTQDGPKTGTRGRSPLSTWLGKRITAQAKKENWARLQEK